MYYHITETTALSVRDRIVDFCKIHFQRKENWHLVFGVAERLYNYRAPIIAEFYEDGGEYPFSDVSEAGFLFVLKQMKKVGSLKFGWENTDGIETAMNQVLINPTYLKPIKAITTTKDEKGRIFYQYAGNIHKEGYFVSGGGK
jgi:hypothetical protein